jgi:UDP-N-acetylmuramate dehydrogenase
MNVINHCCLRVYHTFALPVRAQQLIRVESLEDLSHAYQQIQRAKQPLLLLGEGSNTLFCEDFQGTILLIRLKGIQVEEQADAWHLRVAAGENWHQLVKYTIQQGMAGLENLGLIPGSVGGAALQNIGAYGAEFKQFCHYVDLVDLQQGQTVRHPVDACQFAYRDSLLKRLESQRWIIVAVGLKIAKAWQPRLTYGELTQLSTSVTPQALFETICAIRRAKLPDPLLLGNAGSFFKNPLITVDHLNDLLVRYPDLPYYPQSQQWVKVAAGWLIEQGGLKGCRIGDVAVHQQQALVLVNLGGATPQQVLALAKRVHQQILQQFAISLEPEICLIGATGPLHPDEVLA